MERERNPGNGSLRCDMPATVRTVVSASTGSRHAQKGRKGQKAISQPDGAAASTMQTLCTLHQESRADALILLNDMTSFTSDD
jgi:hypothetical protein